VQEILINATPMVKLIIQTRKLIKTSFVGKKGVLRPSFAERNCISVYRYFFVLLNAYYSGAMTMFFTSTLSVPFTSMRNVNNSTRKGKSSRNCTKQIYFHLLE
jgi:hypothetical protein